MSSDSLAEISRKFGVFWINLAVLVVIVFLTKGYLEIMNMYGIQKIYESIGMLITLGILFYIYNRAMSILLR